MECPSCQTPNPAGQKFCGSCGHKLEVVCARCQTPNPAHFKFCGLCGLGLADVGAVTLARSGLITQVNPKALEMLGCHKGDMQGKPFTLFVARADLVIFFSHWNELVRGAKQQSFEIRIKHKKKESIYARLECSVDPASTEAGEPIHILLSEISDSRRLGAQLQSQQELLGLIFTVVENISTVSGKHLALSIDDALKKICLFTQADLCFIYSINRPLNRLDPVNEWRQSSAFASEKEGRATSVPLSRVKRMVLKLRQEKTVVIQDAANLTPLERDELLAWHQIQFGAVIYHLVYSGKIPIGIMGAAKINAGPEWPAESVALVKFFGGFIAERLPFAAGSSKKPESAPAEIETPAKGSQAKKTQEEPPAKAESAAGSSESDKGSGDPAIRSVPDHWPLLPDMSRPMLLEKAASGPEQERHPVFVRDDGLVLLTCPHCGTQEPVSMSRFGRLGSAVQVSCPCRKHFTAVLEKRRFFRKAVHLEGYFSVGGDLGPTAASGSIWGQMVVKDLSKTGLRFTSDKAHLVHPSDLLIVRFNLDNTSQSLIHKPARVITATSHGIGCLFEGADSYDITLGFYFM